jgi:site-specific DNA-methyltransferase (adenine-specific)
MNDTLSSDKYFQQIFRCMTESSNKKMGFVCDFNISRVLNTLINYTISNNNLNTEDKIKYLIENHLINIDVDIMKQKNMSSDNVINKIMAAWKQDPINNFKTLLKNIDDDYILFDNDTQKKINKLFQGQTDNHNIKVSTKPTDENQPLPTGRHIITNEDNKEEKQEEDKKEEFLKNIDFNKDVLPLILPLTCILTIKNQNRDFVRMLNDIKDNSNLMDMFDEMCFIWWGHKELLDIIKNIIETFFDKNSNTYNVCINFKMALQSLIDRPKELLELINDCLKPNKKETQLYGEVFTPMEFIINKMLKDLEVYYLSKYNKNIYEEEHLKWGDTSAGMGNYPVAIYYKLMDGLKYKIIDINERKRYILEKMLYMGELSKKNCFLIKQIFDINDEYKLNLYQGDSLRLDLQKEFGLSKFDILIGNPPYNEELNKTGGKPLYNKFIEYYLNKCDIMSYITPSRWFSGGKCLDNFRQMMLNRTDILYIKHHKNAKDIFGNSVDIEGGVNYFLIDKNHNGLCNYNGNDVKLNNFDIVLDVKYYDLVNKFLKYDKITTYYISQDHYKIQTNDKRLINENRNDYLKCYVSQQKGFVKYIDKKEIKKDITNYKVITARANGKNGCFGNTFIGYPNEIHTKSYISFNVSNENEAKSLSSYMKCRLPNFILSLRKLSQDISESTCKWIPLPPLDRIWTNNEIYKYFNLTDDDINLINNTNIIGYKDIELQPQQLQPQQLQPQQLQPQQLPTQQLQPQQLQPQQLPTQQLQPQQLQPQQLQPQQLQPQQLQPQQNFNKMTIPQLKEECKKRNLKNYSKLNKQPLLELLLKNL